LLAFFFQLVGYKKTHGWSNIDGHCSIPTLKMDHAIWSEVKQGFVKMKEKYKDFLLLQLATSLHGQGPPFPRTHGE
jgi:hypothetical protein